MELVGLIDALERELEQGSLTESESDAIQLRTALDEAIGRLSDQSEVAETRLGAAQWLLGEAMFAFGPFQQLLESDLKVRGIPAPGAKPATGAAPGLPQPSEIANRLIDIRNRLEERLRGRGA